MQTFPQCLAALAVLGLAAAVPAQAQNLTYTLSGVTFNDGAVATGSFSYDFTAMTFGSFDVTTTNGLGDGLLGTHYVAPTFTPGAGGNDVFDFIGIHGLLDLETSVPDNAPGTIPLAPGSGSGSSFVGSGELAPNGMGGLSARVITAGSLIAVPTPVPEASTTASFGLLLALGLGGLAVAKKRRQRA